MAEKILTVNAAGQELHESVLETSAGAADAGSLVRLDSNGKLDGSMVPLQAEPQLTAEMRNNFAGSIAAGRFVSWAANGGYFDKADAANGATPQATRCIGFLPELVGSLQMGTVQFEGINDQLSGLTVGNKYYLDPTTPGGVTDVEPTGAGESIVYVGKAVSATSIAVEIARPILIA